MCYDNAGLHGRIVNPCGDRALSDGRRYRQIAPGMTIRPQLGCEFNASGHLICGDTPFGGGVDLGGIVPEYRVKPLACETGVFHTSVTNNTKSTIPPQAVITVHGVEAPCTFTGSGPLAPGQSRSFAGCPEKVLTCRASAKWEI
jgi:hypothetical protein